jgi:hypothetical protein
MTGGRIETSGPNAQDRGNTRKIINRNIPSRARVTPLQLEDDESPLQMEDGEPIELESE